MPHVFEGLKRKRFSVHPFDASRRKSRNTVHPFLFLVLLTSVTVSVIWFILSSIRVSSTTYIPSRIDDRPDLYTIAAKNERQKPRFFLHIGPHKTATTSIQCALYNYKDELKEKDVIVFLGKVDGSFCSSMRKKVLQDDRIRNIDKCIIDTNCWTSVTQEWEAYHRQGFDMVLSKELLSDLAAVNHTHPTARAHFWSVLTKALVNWNVTVVITYRRYFEWLPSAFNQYAYHNRILGRQPWPQSPSQVLPTVADVVAGVVNGTLAPPYPFVDELLKWRFPPHWNIYVMNMHRTNDVVQAFLCTEVLNAKHVCSHYQPIPPRRTSPQNELVYDYLNVQALHWGWMKAGKRGQLSRSTRAFVQNVLRLSPQDLPKICPSRALQESFLEYSLAMEKQVLGAVDVKDHTDLFWLAAPSLCTVNAKKVLSTNKTMWKMFYESFEPS